jgi:uncharacterized protein
MSAKDKTLVLGASVNRERYSYLAVKKLLANQKPVIAVGNKPGNIDTIEIATGTPFYSDVDTVTLYLNPTVQKNYYEYILSLKPRRIIFNPGTENDEFSAMVQESGIIAQEACTLVLLSTGQY